VCAVCGGLVFGAGWMLASLGVHHYFFTALGIGVVGAIGVGMAYLVPISTLILWFPRHKGLVTGVSVAGFAAGAALVTKCAHYFMASCELTPFRCFLLLGAMFVIVTPLAGAFMARPPHSQAAARRPVRLKEFLGHPQFALLYFAMFTGLMSGFTVIANLKQVSPGATAASGVMALSLLALANAAGRIAWGQIFDQKPSRVILSVNLFAQAVVLFISPWLTRTPVGLAVFAILSGFNYGGILVLYAVMTARVWGAEKVAPIYGWLFSCNIPASLSPWVAGMIYDHWHSFTVPLWAIAGAMLCGGITLMAGRSLREKR
ncbi:MAG: MFS transporter, partial [Candidatus Sumerlaeota bacterium]|nr:MFS transporter [Candidatus Sumerlaeota bacterium]